MRKLIFIMALLLIVTLLPATITYSSVTSKTLNTFGIYTASTTVVVADTASNYIASPTFVIGDRVSNKGILIQGYVNTALQHTVNAAVVKVLPVLQVSADGVNFVDAAIGTAYIITGATATKVMMYPVSLSGIYAPYIRVKWLGWGASEAYAADIFGKITTTIVVPSSP